jgi:uncharacterized membrane protein
MKHRLELFSDAVLAIIITIMVLDLHTPSTGGWHAFVPILPSLGIYAIGFFILGSGWLWHHQYFAHFETFNHKMMWSNFFFLFIASLLPLLIRNLADHLGDAADTVAIIVWVLSAAISLTFLRLASHRDNMHRPEFLDWYKRSSRRALLFLYPSLILQVGVACVWPRIGLALFVIYNLWVAILGG